MKRIALAFLFIAFSYSGKAQWLYFGGGSNLSFTKCDALDFIVQRYNETRVDTSVIVMSDAMENFGNISGTAFTFGAIKESGFMIEMNWVGRNGVVKAQGTPAGDVLQERDVKLRNNTFGFGFGYAASSGHFHPGIDLSFDLGLIKTFTRTASASEIKSTSYELSTSDFNFALTLTGNLFTLFNKSETFGLLIRPYYQYSFTKSDFSELNTAINPNTWFNDDFDLQVGRANSYGVMLMLVLGGD